jgi:outer membrane protein OmpA-like peptidoglycan-associated protein
MKRVLMVTLVLAMALTIGGCGKYTWWGGSGIPAPIAVGEVVSAPAPAAAPAAPAAVQKGAPAPIVIYFDFDKSNITAGEEPKIAQAVKLLKDDPTATARLEGNTDPYGTDKYNLKLGMKRAESVKRALVAQGIDAKRIEGVSLGESNLADKNAKGKEANRVNRRTVVIIRIK